jgi:hypothetical protein
MLKGLLVKGQVLNVISMMIDTDRFDCILQRRVKIVPIYSNLIIEFQLFLFLNRRQLGRTTSFYSLPQFI